MPQQKPSILKAIATLTLLLLILSQINAFEYTSNAINENTGTPTEHLEKENAHQNPGNTGLLFLVLALFAGISIKRLLRHFHFPYTVALLLLGLGAGLLVRLGSPDHWQWGVINLTFLSNALHWAGGIDPHTILFVFLPTLIFEASFNMDPHTFRKTFSSAFILAVPGILLGLGLAALLCMGIQWAGWGLFNWNWAIALLFGTLISATDPVAVVALLKELGVSKKLNMLIDSESLLNDGTAIVLFIVFLGIATGVAGTTSPVVSFLVVSLGGAATGIILAKLVSQWLKKVFNDPLFEATIIIAAAYFVFYAAESFLHVSGVIGTVAFGLYMAGKGRMRISPEVHHFLEEFWELAVFIANTLIFIIVGIVIAQNVRFGLNDLFILGILFAGLNIIRFIMVFTFFPLLRKTGYGLSKESAIVLAWGGGLRGAVGLALALLVAGNSLLNENIRHQILFYTAGMVVLSALINALTTGPLIRLLKLNNLSNIKKQMIANAEGLLRQSSLTILEKAKKDRFLAGADWQVVETYVPHQTNENNSHFDKEELTFEIRRRLLHKERSAYHEEFNEGLLGAEALEELSGTVDIMSDNDGRISLSDRKDIEYMWQINKFYSFAQRLPLLKNYISQRFYDRLAFGYDCARGYAVVHEHLLKALRGVAMGIQSGIMDEQVQDIIDTIESEINENRIQALTFLRMLKDTYPEMYHHIETMHASRFLLNHQKISIEKLLNQRTIEPDEALDMTARVEMDMDKLINAPLGTKQVNVLQTLKKSNTFGNIDGAALQLLAHTAKTRLYNPGQTLIKADEKASYCMLIVSGKAQVLINDRHVGILGADCIIGEMAFLSEQKRFANVVAETPINVLQLPYTTLEKIILKLPALKEILWQQAAPRIAVNLMVYNGLSPEKAIKESKKGIILKIMNSETLNLETDYAILLEGSLHTHSGVVNARNNYHRIEGNITAIDNAVIFRITQK